MFNKKVNIFLYGEMGIGKEVVVCVLYDLSICVVKLFIVVNCVLILELLIESELFGYVVGSFIGGCSKGVCGLI